MPAKVSYWYLLTNSITNCFSSSSKEMDHLVKASEYELDIIRLIKKMKVVERSLSKRELLEPFKPKMLKLAT